MAEVVYKTLQTTPKDETHWTVRGMAKESGQSKDAVHRIWKTFGLKPHLQEHFKLSTDPFFVDKVRDIVGLYLNPPDHAVVLCVDEKSQIQALERSQPLLPLGLGYVEGVTHDYKRHGTTTLFAALDVATGQVLGQCKPRHRHQEFLRPPPQSHPPRLIRSLPSSRDFVNVFLRQGTSVSAGCPLTSKLAESTKPPAPYSS